MRRLPGGVDLPDFFRNKSTRTQFSICCYMLVLGQSPKLDRVRCDGDMHRPRPTSHASACAAGGGIVEVLTAMAACRVWTTPSPRCRTARGCSVPSPRAPNVRTAAPNSTIAYLEREHQDSAGTRSNRDHTGCSSRIRAAGAATAAGSARSA